MALIITKRFFFLISALSWLWFVANVKFHRYIFRSNVRTAQLLVSSKLMIYSYRSFALIMLWAVQRGATQWLEWYLKLVENWKYIFWEFIHGHSTAYRSGFAHIFGNCESCANHNVFLIGIDPNGDTEGGNFEPRGKRIDGLLSQQSRRGRDWECKYRGSGECATWKMIAFFYRGYNWQDGTLRFDWSQDTRGTILSAFFVGSVSLA